MRFVPTPLDAPLEWPARRAEPFEDGLLAAVISPDGAPLPDLTAPGTLVVTTGQQPGLFTGPLYAIHKALSAAALASLLSERWDRPVIAVFWVAGDDHDFAEANHASWLGADGSLVTHMLRTRPPEAPLTPMYREPLGPEIDAAFAALERDLPPSEFRDATLGWLRRHFRADATVAGAYAGALAELLAPFGVVCLDSTHPAAKRAMARHLVRAVGLAPQLDEDLRSRADELRAAGRDPGVTVGDGATLVMLEGRLGRDRLVRDGQGFVTRRGGERLDRAAIERIAAEDPRRLSPNVLLRPVVESALLPTVAYIAGPGELRYLALTPPIYQRMRIPAQLPVPRWSGMLVEPRVDRVLEKFGATLEELLQPNAALEARIARAQLSPEAGAALERLRSAVGETYDVLVQAARAIDPTLEKPVQNARGHALSEAAEVEKRLVSHLRKRQETEARQIARARDSLLPGGKPQERVLGVAPFLARYGPDLLIQLRTAIGAWYRAALEGGPASP